jgi:hypothetical protein
VKAGVVSWCAVTVLTQPDAKGVRRYVNLSNGAIGATEDFNSPASPGFTVKALGNGWYRISPVMTAAAGVVVTGLRVQPANADSGRVYAAASTSDDQIYIWGAQLEAGAFPSSYVPTTTASATRAADVLTYTAGLTYPASLWCEFERAVDTGGTELYMVVDDGDLTDYAALNVNGSDQLSSIMVSGSVSQGVSTVSGATSTGTVYKAASRFATNSIRSARGGSLGGEDTVATLPANPTTIRLGAYAGGINYCFGYIRRIAATNFAPTDAQLQAMTT